MKNGKDGVVREIMMGSPVTLKSDDTLDLANDAISLGRIRHIPIVESGKLVGVLSDRDFDRYRREPDLRSQAKSKICIAQNNVN